MKAVVAVSAVALLSAGSAWLTADSRFSQKLSSDRQIVHVLNRLAYGPRPGDVEAVRRASVERWIQQQLNPDQIEEDPALVTKLQGLETLRLATWQALERYRPPTIALNRPNITQVLTPDQARRLVQGTVDERRAILNGLDPAQRTQVLAVAPVQVTQNLPEFEEEAGKARAAEQVLIQAELRKANPPLPDLITPDQQRILMQGTPEEKTALLKSFDAEKRMQVMRRLPQNVIPEPLQREAMMARQPQQVVTAEAIEARLLRARYSTRQLEEVLVDFWTNHFNVYTEKGQVRMLITSYERDAIRPHVLGHFRDMLLASARHPAMLFYLDNWQSRAAPDPTTVPAQNRPALNENYGRELLELHTLGVDGGYTQADVIAVARCFTGWTIFDPNRYGEFQFNPANHDRGEKVVLGHVIPRGGGEEDGVKVIDILVHHPSTARFISRKLAQRFVADDPPQELVDRMAATFTETDGDLRAVMNTLLRSREFMSEGAWQAKIKSPLELVVSALRALNADVKETTALAQRLSELGQPMYGKSEPTGYSNVSDGWANSAGLLGRMRFATALTAGQIRGVSIDSNLAAGGVRRGLNTVFGLDPAPELVAAIEGGLGGAVTSPALESIIIGSPDFQRR